MDIVSVPGRLVRDPVTRRVVGDTPVSVDPAAAPWARLLADGDVVETSAAIADHPATPVAPASKDEPA